MDLICRETEHRPHKPQEWEQTDTFNYRLAQHKLLINTFPPLHVLKPASCAEVATIGSEKDPHVNIRDIWLHQTAMGPRAFASLLATKKTPNTKPLYVKQGPKAAPREQPSMMGR